MYARRITIQRTEYVREKHLIMWQVYYSDPGDPDYGKQVTLAYRANDLAAAVLNNPNIQITEENALVFNREILGKTITLVDIPQVSDPSHFVSGDVDSLVDYNIKMKDYPFEEVYDLLSKSE